MKTPILAPSLLSADFANLQAAIKQIEENKGSAVHIDVMDGQFVPEITYGEPVVRSIRKLTKLPFDVHLMTEHPERQIELFAAAGADWITFHLEATPHSHRLIQLIHEQGKKAGVASCPASLPGIYPCGEGAGYAGGIVSSALDGINVAVAVARSLKAE